MKFQRGAPGNGGNGKPPDDKPEEKPTKHDGYLCARLYVQRALDLRREDHRFLHKWKLNLIEDLGGPNEVNVFQTAMIDQSIAILIILNKMSQYVEETGIMTKGGELAPCLRSSYLAYSNSLRHCLEAAYSVGKRSKRVPSLGDYLKDANLKDLKEEGDHGKEARSGGGEFTGDQESGAGQG